MHRTLEDVFQHVASQPEREYLLGLSIMEIYNEVKFLGPEGRVCKLKSCYLGVVHASMLLVQQMYQKRRGALPF